MPTGSKNGKSHLVAVRLPLLLYEQLKGYADLTQQTVTVCITQAVKEYLQKRRG